MHRFKHLITRMKFLILVHPKVEGGTSKLNLMKKRRVVLTIAFLIGLMGAGNLIIGAWSLFTIHSLNLPDRISSLNSVIDSFDPSMVKTLELQDPLSNLKNSVAEELNFLFDYSQLLNAIPVYLIAHGILLVTISSTIYFIDKEEKGSKES